MKTDVHKKLRRQDYSQFTDEAFEEMKTLQKALIKIEKSGKGNQYWMDKYEKTHIHTAISPKTFMLSDDFAKWMLKQKLK